MLSPPSRRIGLISLLAGALLLAACAPAPMLQPPDAATPEAPPEGGANGLQEYYDQDLDWTDCGDRHRCTRVQVPMDYDDPDGDTIELAVKVAEALGTSEGALFVNPGGPGSSGLEFLDSVDAMFSGPILQRFDVVGFDPRGVGESDAVRCLDSGGLEEYYGTFFEVTTDAGWEDFVATETDYGHECLENTGDLLGFVDTVSAAQDLDVLRAVMGEDSMTYLGYSYGTFLGATYAEHFPDRVHRLVLDGAMNPALDYAEIAGGQVLGFDRAYRSFVTDCQAGPDCPFEGGVDEAIAETVDLLTTLRDDPMPATDPDRPVTDADLINTIVLALYNVDSWPVLSEALTMLIYQADASQVRFISDLALEREDDGTYPEDQGAFRAINCLDFPVELDRDEIIAEAEALEDISEVFGPYFGYGEVGCSTMPFEATGTRAPIAATGAPPILVIGTTRDPATPHEWSEALAEQLESGVLLSYDGDGHGAYGGHNSCVHEAVDAYLLEGQVPEDGTQC
ncbi:alpha/beta hydrolase [Pseudactinotalea sp. Z1739]|uniref:alpha/beta hydrolase n=1 Tax=Pseudactinotalea sp. Z1739 TaxID=3413028 RepID=UPI003C7B05B7